MCRDSSFNFLCISTLTTNVLAITKKIFIYIHTRGKEKKYSSVSVFGLMEWLPGPGEILQLSVFLTEPLFCCLLFDGGLQRVWHPAKCPRLAATLEAVIMARRCLATRAAASPRCADMMILSRGVRRQSTLLSLWDNWCCALVILVIESCLWKPYAS